MDIRRKFYTCAFRHYGKAHTALEKRENNPQLWDDINWEHFSALMALADRLSPIYVDKLHVNYDGSLDLEVVDLLMQALHLCAVETPGERQLQYQHRQVDVYRRLGNVYANLWRRRNYVAVSERDTQTVRQYFKLSHMYYTMATQLIAAADPKRDWMPDAQRVLYLQLIGSHMQLYESFALGELLLVVVAMWCATARGICAPPCSNAFVSSCVCVCPLHLQHHQRTA